MRFLTLMEMLRPGSILEFEDGRLKPVAYISGPMRGLADKNFPAFDAAEATLSLAGWNVVNPANLDRWHGSRDEDVADYAERDLSAVQLLRPAEGDVIVVLPKWYKSRGAIAEVAVANWLGVPIKRLTGEGRLEAERAPVQAEEAARPGVRTFESGATRDSENGKLDYEGFFSPLVLRRRAEYMHKNRYLADGSTRDSDNWQKGIPATAYMKSAWRHFMDWWTYHRQMAQPGGADADAVEEALCGVLFNAEGYLHELLKAKTKAKAGNQKMPPSVESTGAEKGEVQ